MRNNKTLNNSVRAASSRTLRLAAMGAMVGALAACANMSGITPQATLRDAASLGLAANDKPAVSAEWWREFGDAQLNQLMAQALASNPSLKLAQARLARAQAVTEVADAVTLPQLNGAVDLTHQRYTAHG
ncbi:MAG: efflux transporter outer membrane subunit, partial [Burkholderiaceae bacterium]